MVCPLIKIKYLHGGITIEALPILFSRRFLHESRQLRDDEKLFLAWRCASVDAIKRTFSIHFRLFAACSSLNSFTGIECTPRGGQAILELQNT